MNRHTCRKKGVGEACQSVQMVKYIQYTCKTSHFWTVKFLGANAVWTIRKLGRSEWYPSAPIGYAARSFTAWPWNEGISAYCASFRGRKKPPDANWGFTQGVLVYESTIHYSPDLYSASQDLLDGRPDACLATIGGQKNHCKYPKCVFDYRVAA